jgi:hypothetical protein
VLRFKQFVGQGAELEDSVNQWLTDFEPDVTQMVQTRNGDGTIVISFLFEESFRGQELRFTHERHLGAATTPTVNIDAVPDRPVHVEPDR